MSSSIYGGEQRKQCENSTQWPASPAREITGRTFFIICGHVLGMELTMPLTLGKRSTTEVYPHTSWFVSKILLYGPGWFGTLEFNRSSCLSLQGGGGTLQAKATGATHQFSGSGQ